MENWVMVSELARQFNVSTMTIYNKIRDGKLETRINKMNNRTLVNTEEFRNLQNGVQDAR
jgi:DeoR/GlpR family transcriptional regulator of sugar metabolism